jgi:energy-coupling factor transporter ATP-binding protein EcfA2
MTEGQGVTAASVPLSGAGAGAAHVQGPDPAAGPPPVAQHAAGGADSASGRAADGGARRVAADVEPHVRVDARKLESALLALRHQIVELPLLFEAPGVAEARAERRKLLSQIDDYLLPRLRQSEAPILVALVGSTGAGKSTLMNSLVGMKVSATGIRRPTTNSPVLACHPSDARWFAENVFLPTLPRVRQQGLAMPGRDGLLVLAASEGMPRGVALLDTPDIDSVVQAHREFAHQFLDASDLWLFMTSSSRYADAAVWELLQQARDRGAALAIVLSRVPEESARPLTAHFDAMLAANGLRTARRFMIAETVVTDGTLPPAVYGPVRQWLEDTALREERRIAVLTQTMSGVLDTFRARVPALAAQAEEQLVLRSELQACAESAYAAGLAELDEATRNGSLLRGEILARWQEFAGTGDLLRMLQVRRPGRPAARPRRRRTPARANALKTALRTGLETLVASIADRAAEDVVTRWQEHSAGAALLGQVAAAGAGRPAGESGLTAAVLEFAQSASNGSLPAAAGPAGVASLARSSPDLATRAARAISAWQDHVMHLVESENVTKRSVARVAAFDGELLALVLTVGLLGYGAGDVAVTEGTSAVPQRILTAMFGAGLLRDLGARARLDLHGRVSLLFSEETRRFIELVDAAGEPDETAAAELYQAAYALEAAR